MGQMSSLIRDRWKLFVAVVTAALMPAAASAQAPPATDQAPPVFKVEVIAATPLPGSI